MQAKLQSLKLRLKEMQIMSKYFLTEDIYTTELTIFLLPCIRKGTQHTPNTTHNPPPQNPFTPSKKDDWIGFRFWWSWFSCQLHMEVLCFWFIHIRSNPNPVNCCSGLLKLWYHLLIGISTFIDWYFLDKWDLYGFFPPFIAIIRILLLQHYWVYFSCVKLSSKLQLDQRSLDVHSTFPRIYGCLFYSP